MKESIAMMNQISVVVPCYKCSGTIKELVERLNKSVSKISSSCEIILVNDGSPENDWECINELVNSAQNVIGLNLSRNFGQHTAITAGVDYCSGHWVVVMDGDLQDRPEEIPKLYQKAGEGFDVVFARRKVRKDSFFKRMLSKMFYMIFSIFVDEKADPAVANFGIYSRRVVDSFKKMTEHTRLFPFFVRWLGFQTAYIDVEHDGRRSGKSSYSFLKRLNLAVDAIVVMSNKPLKISIGLGLIISLLSFIFSVYLIVRYFILGIPVMGWTSMVVSLFFIGGLLLSITGVLGLYIGKIFDEVKNRPLYIVADTVSGKEGFNDK